MKPTDFSFYLTKFLSQYLPSIVGLSKNTIFSYRDTFKMFIKFCSENKKLKPEKITLITFDKEIIVEYLDWLEQICRNASASRNVRLSAIHSFCRYLQQEAPEFMNSAQKILAIPLKKIKKLSVNYIGIDAMRILLDTPDKNALEGRRDITLLSLLYDSGARVQEIADLKIRDLRLETPPTIKLTGKGNKSRIVPLMKPMADLLKQYLKDNSLNKANTTDEPVFTNRSNEKLTRAGIACIVKKYVDNLQKTCPGQIPKKFSPHCFRHSKAMHLLQSDVNIIYIRDFLGHVDVRTTEIYARIDGEMKRKALEKSNANIVSDKLPEWQSNTDLMKWLCSLGN